MAHKRKEPSPLGWGWKRNGLGSVGVRTGTEGVWGQWVLGFQEE